MPEPWYRRDGDVLHPTGVAAAPHAPDAQHGAAVAGLIGRAVDATPAPVPMDVVRLTVDLTRLVPAGPTRVETVVRRSGRRVQVVEAALSVDGIVLTRSAALRIRREDVVDPADQPVPDDAAPRYDPAGHATTSPWEPLEMMTGMELSWEWWEAGRGVCWIRLDDQLVEGETMTPVTRAAIAADIVMTAGGLLPSYAMVNPDLTLSLVRPPRGQRIRIESTVRVDPSGHGVSNGALGDETGRFATVTKSLLVTRR